jgi:hypothetical protein
MNTTHDNFNSLMTEDENKDLEYIRKLKGKEAEAFLYQIVVRDIKELREKTNRLLERIKRLEK